MKWSMYDLPTEKKKEKKSKLINIERKTCEVEMSFEQSPKLW